MTTNVNGYRPPMGRPISSPRDSGPPPLPCAKAPSKPPEVVNTRPVKMDGESKQAYGARLFSWQRANDPSLDARFRQNCAKSARRAIRKIAIRADNIASARNKTETRGVWMTARQYAKTRPWEAGTNCYERANKYGWPTEKVAGRMMFLVPHEHINNVAKQAPNQVIEVPVVARPSIWQRVASWLWG